MAFGQIALILVPEVWGLMHCLRMHWFNQWGYLGKKELSAVVISGFLFYSIIFLTIRLPKLSSIDSAFAKESITVGVGLIFNIYRFCKACSVQSGNHFVALGELVEASFVISTFVDVNYHNRTVYPKI